jgi:hypothetical protein
LAKPLKIEQYNLQDMVAAGLRAGKNPQQIAEECTRKAGVPISNMAVRRYIEAMEGKASVMTAPTTATVAAKRVERAVKSVPKRVERIVDRDIDLIDLQFRTTAALADRFEWISSLPDTFEARMQQLHELLKLEGTDTTTLDHWGLGFTLELRRNIGSMAALNREIRENAKFMSSLREKAFEFSLIQEYLMLFLEAFKKAEQENHGSTVAYEAAEQQIASNPRMQRIVEQQKELRGYEEG